MPLYSAKKSKGKNNDKPAVTSGDGGNVADLDADDFLSGGFMSMAGLPDDEDDDGGDKSDGSGGGSAGDSDSDDSGDDAGVGEGEAVVLYRTSAAFKSHHASVAGGDFVDVLT